MDCSGVAPPPITDSPGVSSAFAGPAANATSRSARARISAALWRIMRSAGTWSQSFQQQMAQRGFERLVNHLVQPQRAKHGIAPQARDDLRFSRQDARLRPAQQFIAAERNQVRAGPQAVGTSGSSMPNGRKSTTQPLPRSS